MKNKALANRSGCRHLAVVNDGITATACGIGQISHDIELTDNPRLAGCERCRKTAAWRHAARDEIDLIGNVQLKPGLSVYLSGPMSGLENDNRAAFHAAAAGIKDIWPDCRIFNPAKLPRGWSYDRYLEADLRLVRRADVIVLLPGWKNSQGARIEVIEAVETGKRIIHWDELGLMSSIGILTECVSLTERCDD